MIKTFFHCATVLLLFSLCPAQATDTAIHKSSLLSSQITRVEAQPKKGFLYPFYIYVPPEVARQKNQRTSQTLLVVPNNTGKADDDLAVHDYNAQGTTEWLSTYAAKLNTVLLIPVFPRPAADWQIYTHALDRDSLLTDKKELKRLDLQLIQMIDYARGQLASEGLRLDKKVLMFGFSASGMFANRFTFLHPGRVKAAAFGSPGGWAIAPIETWKGKSLRYPIGTADIKSLTGKPFDRKSLSRVPLFLFMGDTDANDSVIYRDSYEEMDEKLIFDLFGKTPVERWKASETIYKANLPQATLKLYAGGGHSISEEMWEGVIVFFSKHLHD